MMNFLLLATTVVYASLTVATAFEPAIGSITTTTTEEHELRRHVLRKLLFQQQQQQAELPSERDLEKEYKADVWAKAPVGVVANFLQARGVLEQPIAATISDVPSMTPSDMPSSMPSDMPSSMPSDMPSMMPSDQPSLSPMVWEEKDAPPPAGGDNTADAALAAGESSSTSPSSGANSKLIVPLSIGLGALLTAFIIFRMRRRALARDISAEAEVRMDETNVAFLEEGVSPRAPSPVAASNQFDSQFSEDDGDDDDANSHNNLSKASSHGLSNLSNYQMSDIGDADTGSLVGGYPQLSNTGSVVEGYPPISNTITL